MNDNNQLTQQLGKELLNSAATGLAGGLGAGSLYYILSALSKADPTSLLPQTDISGAAAGLKLRPKVKNKKELPSRAKTSPVNMYKSANSLITQLQQRFGELLPKSYIPGLDRLFTGKTRIPAETGAQEMWRNVANLGLAVGGGYTGIKTVNSIADAQRQADIKDDVEAARAEYFDALTGKNAAHLDAAFDAVFTKISNSDNSANSNIFAALANTIDNSSLGRSFSSFVATPAALTALATGLMGGTYMYDQTKKRTRAENLQRAAAARARLAGLQKTPYVDPVELAALTKK